MASMQSVSDVFPIKTQTTTTTTTTTASNVGAMNAVVSITETAATTSTTTAKDTVSWTLSDFHTSASNWSLHGDAKLLELMESISKNLERKCLNTQKNIDQMMFGIDRTKIRLENTTNTMLSLKNQKFMEARVHDEVEITTNTSNTAGSSSSSVVDVNSNEISLTPLTTLKAIKIAVDNGIVMMDKCYEKVTIDLNDDDDEDGSDLADQSKCIIYRPKNPHYDRPLPHIIGSKEFNEKWHIGLIESEDDDDDDDNDDEDDNDNNIENLLPHMPCSESLSSYGIGGGAGGGHHSSDSASISVSMTSTNAPAESDTDYSRHSEQRNPNIFHHSNENLIGKDTETQNQHYPPQPSVRKMIGHLPTQPQPPPNLKNKPDLFDDSSDTNDDDLFSLPVPKKIINDRVKVLPVGPQFTGSVNNQQAPPPTIFRQQKPTPQSVNIFNDEPPELESTGQLKIERKPVNLFLDSDDDDDLFKSSTISSKITNEKSTIPIAKPRINTTNVAAPVINKTKTINLFDDVTEDDDDELLFSNSKSNINNSTIKENQSNIVINKTKPIITNLFDDDDDDDGTGPPEDDLFNSMISQSKNIIKKPEVVKKSIFDDDDDDDDDDDLFGTVSSSAKSMQSRSLDANKATTVTPTTIRPTTASANIFDENSDSGEEQFPPPTKISIKSNETKNNANFNDKPKSNVQPKKKTNIFDDDDDEEDDFDSIFVNKPKEQPDTTIKPIISLFGDNLDDDNLFVPNKKLNNKTSVKPKSIFDDDDDDDDSDLFFSATKQKSSTISSDPLLTSKNIENTNEKPVVPVVTDKIFEEKQISIINSLPPSPTTSKKSIKSEQFANFLTKDETNTDSISFVHNRRPFVSFLENENSSSGDESVTNDKINNPVDDDEWKSDNDGNSVPEINVPTETVVINNEQSKSVIKVTELFDSQLTDDDDDDDDDDVDKLPTLEENPPSEINVFDNKIDSSDVKIKNFEKLPQSISEKPITQLANDDDNDLFAENSKPSIENNSVTVKKNIITTNVGLFDDLPPDDDFLSTITKTTAEYNSTFKQSNNSIFNDQPPPDDHFEENTKIQSIINKTDLFAGISDEEIDEDFPIIKSKSSSPIKTTSTIKSALLLSSPFDDLPPIDDFVISPPPPVAAQLLPQSPTDVSSIEDDLFDRSIKDIAKPSTKSSIPLFLDDPPPDDDDDDSDDFLTNLVKSNEKTNSTITKNVYYNDFDETIPEIGDLDDVDKAQPTISSFKNNLEKFTKSNDELLSIQQPAKQQPPPMRRKITDNLMNINVAALLPGAKRPTNTNTTTPPPSVQSISPSTTDNNKDIITTIQTATIIHSSESTTPGSLLIGLNKNRPKMSISRRPSTRKGRKAEYNKSLLIADLDPSSDLMDDSNAVANTSSQSTLQNESIENMFKNAKESDLQSLVSTQMDTTDYFENKMSTSFDDNSLTGASNSSVVIEKEVEDVEVDSKKRLTPIDGEETNRFEEITTAVFDDENDDNNDDDDDDWLEKSLKSSTSNLINKKIPTTIVKPITTIKTHSSNNLFSDEDDDDDDLFSNTKKSVKVSSISSTVPSSTIKPIRSVTSSSLQPSSSSSSATATAATSASTTKSTKTTTTVSKSLFGDDDDDDIDNLFGAIKTKKIVTNKITTTISKDKNEIKSKNGISNSLFGDDDDESDNLFSVSKPKVSVQTKLITTTKKTESRGASTINSKPVDQDPLSDLWKQ